MARGTSVQPGWNGLGNNLGQGGPQQLVRYYWRRVYTGSNTTGERKSDPLRQNWIVRQRRRARRRQRMRFSMHGSWCTSLIGISDLAWICYENTLNSVAPQGVLRSDGWKPLFGEAVESLLSCRIRHRSRGKIAALPKARAKRKRGGRRRTWSAPLG